jgi:hypothetical protein
MTEPNQFALLQPADLRDLRAYILQHRDDPAAPFEFVVSGYTNPPDNAIVQEFAEAGATWWIEGLDWFGAKTIAQIERRIDQGPPRIT